MIRVREGRLADSESEAVLRPVSTALEPVCHPGREVEQEAGEDVLERLRGAGEIPVGGAILTPGGDLAASFIIHVAVQSWDEPVSETGVRRALMNGLRRASEWGIETLSLPPLGAGAGNMDPEDSARLVVEVLMEHMAAQPYPREVELVAAREYEAEIFRGALERSSG